jgi:hypothetical protein
MVFSMAVVIAGVLVILIVVVILVVVGGDCNGWSGLCLDLCGM